MNKSTIMLIIAAGILIFGTILVIYGIGYQKPELIEDKIAVNNDEEIVIKLSSGSNGQYEPSEIKVKTGTKVIIEGDIKTLVGGMDTVIIEGYNLRKLISQNDNKIEFTADKAGEFDIYCANGMGNGKLIVA